MINPRQSKLYRRALKDEGINAVYGPAATPSKSGFQTRAAGGKNDIGGHAPPVQVSEKSKSQRPKLDEKIGVILVEEDGMKQKPAILRGPYPTVEDTARLLGVSRQRLKRLLRLGLERDLEQT